MENDLDHLPALTDPLSQAEANKSLLRRYNDELNRRNIAILDDLVAEDVVVGSLMRGEENDVSRGRAAYQDRILKRLQASPDYQVTILEMIAEGDQVMLYWRNHFTNPAGKVMEETVVSIYRFRRGQIVQVRGIYDRADSWLQQGFIPWPLDAW